MARSNGITRERIVAAATALVDAEGWDALHLGRVASALSIRTPSLYNHVDGLEGLRRELTLACLQDVGALLTEAAIGKSGDVAIHAVAEQYRRYVQAHPGLYVSMIYAPKPGDSAVERAAERVVHVLYLLVGEYASTDEDAIHAVRGLRSIIHGFASLESAGGFALPYNCDESFRRLVQAYIDGLRARAA